VSSFNRKILSLLAIFVFPLQWLNNLTLLSKVNSLSFELPNLFSFFIKLDGKRGVVNQCR